MERLRRAVLAVTAALSLACASPTAIAGPEIRDIDITPSITELSIENGDVIASGEASARAQGRLVTTSFDGSNVQLTVAEGQEGTSCPDLHLELGAINLNLLGIEVETSRICINLADYGEAGLSNVLCTVRGLLNGGLDLGQILGGAGVTNTNVITITNPPPATNTTSNVVVSLPALTTNELNQLRVGLSNVLNGVLTALLDAELTDVIQMRGRNCAVLNFALASDTVDLDGADVPIEDCDEGPVTIALIVGHGHQLANTLCHIIRDGRVEEGQTLREILESVEGGKKFRDDDEGNNGANSSGRGNRPGLGNSPRGNQSGRR